MQVAHLPSEIHQALSRFTWKGPDLLTPDKPISVSMQEGT